jgi:uncharacterized MAPEG superfamily protein
MTQPLNILIAVLVVVVAGFTAAADQQHRPFARPAAAYAPLFGERATAANRNLFAEHFVYFLTNDRLFIDSRLV